MEAPLLNPMVFYQENPKITEQIFQQLEKDSLRKSRLASKSWQECIDDHAFFWKKSIKFKRANQAFFLKGDGKRAHMFLSNHVIQLDPTKMAEKPFYEAKQV